jgi:PAS domain S-box-containing protein
VCEGMAGMEMIERAPHVSDGFFRPVLDALTAMIAVLDVRGQIIAVNASWRRFADANGLRTSCYCLGADYLAVCDAALGTPEEADSCAVARGIRAVLAGELAEFTHEYPCHSPQEERWFLMRATRFHAGDAAHIVVTHENITARHLAEEAMRRSDARARRLLDAQLIGVVVADTERIIEANDAFLRMVGCTQADLAAGGLLWPEMTPPEYAAIDARAIAELIATGSCAPFEKEYWRKDGSRVPILIGATTLQQDPVQWVCFVLDRTAQQEVEEQREQFLASLGHDLKSPLTTIKGMAQLLARQIQRGPVAAEAALPRLETIESAAGRMNGMINELLDHSRIRLGRPLDLTREPADLVALVRRAAAAHEDRGTHRFDLACAVPELMGEWDAQRLTRVLENLLSNACKYSPAGSTVRVSIAREEDAGGALAVLTVADTGIGIPAAALPHIGKRFYRAANALDIADGTGIGLAGAKQIVTQHGGTLAIASDEGAGTTVSVRLPCDRDT